MFECVYRTSINTFTCQLHYLAAIETPILMNNQSYKMTNFVYALIYNVICSLLSNFKDFSNTLHEKSRLIKYNLFVYFIKWDV